MAGPVSATAQAETDFSGISVLLVEDHPFQRKVAAGLLKRLGVVNLMEAGNGRDALDALRAAGEPVDIVLCDLRMPEMDGVEFIRHVAEGHLSGAFILASAMDKALIDTVEAMARVRRVDVLGTVEKPITVDGVRRLLLDFVGRRRRAEEQRARPVFNITEDMVRAAIEADEFVPFFQPKIKVADKTPKGFEVLIRWARPDGSIVPPVAFIPMAETCGLIEPLTEIVLRKSLSALARWRDRYPELSISVNISAVSLSAVDLPDRIDAEVRRHGLEPEAVMLEITETAVLGNEGQELDTLARLRLKGYGLSVDDFGTGYASFQQLHTAPFTEIKVDQSFVTGASHRDKSRSILESCVDLAAKLKLHCVAEGVETEEDIALLAALGCETAQGYHIARPMPEDAASDWLESCAR